MRIGDDGIKEIIDRKNINIIVNCKTLNKEQKIKINDYNNRNNYLLENYYYNKLEIKYEVELLEKLKSIIITYNNDDNNRIDLYLFKVLINLLFDIKNDLKTIVKKNYSINIILNEIELKVKEEKLILENLLLLLHKNNEEFKSRLYDLNKINRNKLKTLLKENHYFIYIRECLIKLLNSSMILIYTFIIIIINYGLLRFQENNRKILYTIFLELELKNAINLFENVKESIIDNNDYNKNFKIQKRYYYNLLNSINKNDKILNYLININGNDNGNDNGNGNGNGNDNGNGNGNDIDINYIKLIDKYYKIIFNDIKQAENLLLIKKNKKNKKINYINIFKIINFRTKIIKELSNTQKLLNERTKNGINDI